jgi:aspartokinase
MPSVTQAVKDIILQKPFLQEALVKGIINIAAFAQEIHSDVELIVGSRVKFSSINMAIHRYSEKLEKSFIKKSQFSKHSGIMIRSDLCSITLEKPIDSKKLLAFFKNENLLTFTQGINEITIISSQKYLEKIKEKIKKPKKMISDLAGLTINLSKEDINNIGIIYLASRSLAWENITIIDVVSTFTELTFIINDKDAGKAYDTLRNAIKEHSI